jgi:hypothetical protein
MKTRRTPRWTTNDNTRLNTLAGIEATAALTDKQRNELERLSGKRSHIIRVQTFSPEMRRNSRKANKIFKYLTQQLRKRSAE